MLKELIRIPESLTNKQIPLLQPFKAFQVFPKLRNIGKFFKD